MAVGVGQRRQRRQPRRPLAGHPGRLLGEALGVEEIVEIDAGFRVEAAVSRQVGNSPRRVEVAQRVGRAVRVAPEPVDFAAKDRVEHRVGAEDLTVQHRRLERRLDAGQQAVRVDSPSGKTVEALGDVDAMDLQPRGAAGRDVQRGPAFAEAVGRVLVAGADDVKVNVGIHQPRFAEGHDAVAVGDVTEGVDGSQFDQRHAAARLVVHHRDGEVAFGVVGFGVQQDRG